MSIIEYEDKIKKIVNNDNHSDFIYDFLSIYDKIAKSTITKLRKGSNNLSNVPGEIYLKNKLYFKEVSNQVLQAYSNLEDSVSKIKSKPRYIIVTDYQQLLAKDEKTGDTLDIKFRDLPQYFDFFLAWNGIEKADFEKENPADLKAAERFAKIFDELAKNNKNVNRHELNLFLIRVLFCLFAEDTNIFKEKQFTNYLQQMTAEDGSDMNDRISELFKFLDKKDRNEEEPSYLKKFPYVNGQLFTKSHVKLNFNKKIRQLIIDAGEFINWNNVNPDILGSMLQAVASEDKRSHLGMHYTSVPNIMKVIKPLFLDELYEKFENAKGNEIKLNALYERIGNIKFMDPACGSGNFLVITYKKLRQLEIDIIKELNNMGIATMYVPSVTLNQFYGIEIEDFACDVTRLSLWITEHQMNIKLHEEIQDAVRPTLPLQKAGAIVCGNALRIDWNEILSNSKNDEIYLFGNPPYLGATNQNINQKEDLKFVFSNENIKTGEFDYVCGWFYKASLFIKNKYFSKYAFVSTNSIVQGKLVGLFWPLLKKYDLEISYAYTSFKWENNAKNNAGVIVVIIGIEPKVTKLSTSKKIYTNNHYTVVKNINAYLIDYNDIYVKNTKSGSIFNLPKMYSGNRPNDNRGKLTFSQSEYNEIVNDNPEFSKYFKNLISSKDYLKGIIKKVLWINESEWNIVKRNKLIYQRVESIRKKRLSTAPNLAKTPWRFRDTRVPNKMAIIIPSTTGENRLYIPMWIIGKNDIANNTVMVVYDSPLWLFGLLESHMHMIWLKVIGGKLGNSYRYSAGLVYNTFPVPNLSSRRKKEIEDLALNILDIRDEEGGTLTELYGSPLAEKNCKPMNLRLLKAHKELDAVVDRAYKISGFKDDSERLSLLLKMYGEKENNNER